MASEVPAHAPQIPPPDGTPTGSVLEACVEVDPEPGHVGLVRAFVRTTLAEWEMSAHVDDVVLIASELVTNAVLHARTPYRVTLKAPDLQVVRVEVADDNPRPPVRTPDDQGATSGRGLHVVAGVATVWGVESDGDGKVVWAEVGAREPEDPQCLDMRGVDTAADAIERITQRRPDPSALS